MHRPELNPAGQPIEGCPSNDRLHRYAWYSHLVTPATAGVQRGMDALDN